MNGHCHVRGQTRPCCRQTLFELGDNRHPRLVVPLKAWGLGSVWKTCCGAIYGMYFNEEINRYDSMYLGRDEEAALGRMNHVKSFIM